MAITREEVLHVARLARLELVRRRGRALPGAALGDPRRGLEGRPSSTSPTCRRPRIRSRSRTPGPRTSPRPCLTLDEAFANAPDRDGDSSGRRRHDRRPRDRHAPALTRRGGAGAARSARRVSRRRRARRAPTRRRSTSATRELHAFLHARRRARTGDGSPDRAQGRDLDAGRPHDRRLEDPRAATSRSSTRPSPRAARPPGCRCSARRTPTSSRWAPRPRTRPTARRTTRGTRRASPAARAAARPRRSRPGSPRGRSAPTRAARSSCPSAFCGNVGLRPTYGTVSRYGVVAFASSLDQVGPVTRNVRDNALLYRIISGRDANDSTTVDGAAGRAARRPSDLKGVRIGVPRQLNEVEGIEPGVKAAVDAAIALAERLGAEIERVRAAALGRLRARLLLPDRPGRGLVESRALRRRPLRPARRRRRLPRDGDAHAPRRVRRRAEAADHARHLRALVRLLRRLLRHRAEGAHGDQARARRAVRALRRARLADLRDRRPSRSARRRRTRSRCT